MINDLKDYGKVLLNLFASDLTNSELFAKWGRCQDLAYFCENLIATPSEWFEAKKLVKEYREIKNGRV